MWSFIDQQCVCVCGGGYVCTQPIYYKFWCKHFIVCSVFSTEDIKRIMTHVSVMQHATLLQMNAEVLKLSEPKSDFNSLNSCDWSDWTFYSNRGRWLHFNENTLVTFEQNKTWTELGFLGLVFHDWSRSWTLWSQLAKVKMHKRVELRALGLAWGSSTVCVCVCVRHDSLHSGWRSSHFWSCHVMDAWVSFLHNSEFAWLDNAVHSSE